MPRRQTKPSTPRLSEVARHVNVPTGIVSTAWPSVRDRCARFGIGFDEWQHGIGKLALSKRADGKYAASVGGVVLSIPRQTGKTYLIGWLVFALCTLFPNFTVIWTAHHGRTSDETFGKMRAMAVKPRLRRYIDRKPRAANGQQEIRFTNGSRILFGAREHGFGRGFDKVDVLIFDEAQKLSEKAMADMVPATNAAPNGLVFLMGTPPRPVGDDGEVFSGRRDDAINGDGDTVYIEFSADDDAGGDHVDWAQLEKANPSFPHRTSKTAILRMKKLIGSAADFRREALGIWDATSRAVPAIDPATFALRKVDAAPSGDQVAYGVKFSPDGSRMALAVALATDDGPFVEVLDSGSTSVGIGGLTSWLVERWQSCDGITIDGKGNAGTLNEALLDAGVNHRKIVRPQFDWVVTANSHLVEAVRDGSMSHAGQPGLTHAVANSARKDRGETGGWNFIATADGADVTALQAVALAMHTLGGQRRRNGRKPGQRNRAVY